MREKKEEMEVAEMIRLYVRCVKEGVQVAEKRIGLYVRCASGTSPNRD